MEDFKYLQRTQKRLRARIGSKAVYPLISHLALICGTPPSSGCTDSAAPGRPWQGGFSLYSHGGRF